MIAIFARLLAVSLAITLAALFVVAFFAPPAQAQGAANRAELERGKYMLTVGSCNDCHTAGFAERNGDIPEKEWLLGGGPLGFAGPWGTTYAPNLRITVSRMTENEWVGYAKALKTRPPMPWFILNQWKEPDLRALYRYVKSLGPLGAPGPQYLPPGQPPPPPVIQWPAPPK